MGIPVSGKNLFPSNIAGLPTWFTIRASKDGYIARRSDSEFLVAMNPESAEEDVLALKPGAACVYDERLNLGRLRDDVVFYPVPFDHLVAPVCPDARLRKLVRNMTTACSPGCWVSKWKRSRSPCASSSRRRPRLRT
jgi:2-oxoglutarate ferredoxin oxidoreductase subunit alpha